MPSALIGYTGFVGSNLLRQTHFDDLYNSKNIWEIEGREYDLVVCAGASAEKWRANKEPLVDAYRIRELASHLLYVRARKLVLISTVDVYPCPEAGPDEDSPILGGEPLDYGRNRAWLERFVRGTFDNTSVVRLPALFGRGLKKNCLYDLIHKGISVCDDQDYFQFYPMSRLWADILKTNQPIRNLPTQPITFRELRLLLAPHLAPFYLDEAKARYDMRTKFDGPYLESKQDILAQIKDFAANETRSL